MPLVNSLRLQTVTRLVPLLVFMKSLCACHFSKFSKGPITWRISARAEISARSTGLKFCCDYMTNFSSGWNISLGTKYEISREESRENQAANIISCFSARAEISFRLHEIFSARGAIQPGLKILARFGQTGLGFSAQAELHPGLKKSPCNRQFDFERICFRSRAEVSARLTGLKFQPGLKFAM